MNDAIASWKRIIDGMISGVSDGPRLSTDEMKYVLAEFEKAKRGGPDWTHEGTAKFFSQALAASARMEEPESEAARSHLKWWLTEGRGR